ncbi:MAG: RDD family protein [Elusimicrobiota bacterium]|jgi:uncharacterized RDD family membrane protein YckC|nr:RDD family protein [Elusimicrobiota bacterium]
MNNIKISRALGLFIDYIVWYIAFVVILLAYVMKTSGVDVVGSGEDYTQLAEQARRAPYVYIYYILFLFAYEILVPLFSDGRTLSKLILKLKIIPVRPQQIIIRGLVKLIIVNPCLAFTTLLAVYFGWTFFIVDVFFGIFLVDIVITIITGSSLQDRLARTEIVSIKGEKNGLQV